MNNTKSTLNTNGSVAIYPNTTDNVVRPVMSVEEYRKLLKDFKTPEKLIKERIQYLEKLCRHVIREDLDNYANN